jgi:hypothetical protein
MNRLDSHVQMPALMKAAPTMVPCTESAGRLAVVIVEVTEEALLASRILELARPLGLPIVLVGIAPDRADERKIRRNLVRIAAFIREGDALYQARPERIDHATRVEIEIVQGKDWAGQMKSFLQHDDMLACYSEQVVGSKQRPLTDILASSTNTPIYSFSGLRITEKSRQNWLPQAAAWLASLVSIAGCFVVQARIVMALQGWAQSLLLLVTLIAEAGLIWLLNSLIGQS